MVIKSQKSDPYMMLIYFHRVVFFKVRHCDSFSIICIPLVCVSFVEIMILNNFIPFIYNSDMCT